MIPIANVGRLGRLADVLGLVPNKMASVYGRSNASWCAGNIQEAKAQEIRQGEFARIFLLLHRAPTCE